MSRTTKAIAIITEELDKISGLTGIVSDKLEALAEEVTLMVQDILENHPNANYFDYSGFPNKKEQKKIVHKAFQNIIKKGKIQS